MSGSFESWNTCVHRLDLGLYSHPKEVVLGFFVFCLGGGGGGRNEVKTHVISKGKSPPPATQRSIEPVTMHHAGERAQHTTD